MVPAHKLGATEGFKIANNEVNSSGALLPTAISVAQATSEESLRRFANFSREGTKNSSQTIASKTKQINKKKRESSMRRKNIKHILQYLTISYTYNTMGYQ
jgi:hypothetical protein